MTLFSESSIARLNEKILIELAYLTRILIRPDLTTI